MADKALKLLMVASEMAPFAKTGGLADVVGSLPPVLRTLGHDVRVVMPWYRAVGKETGALPASRRKLQIPMGGRVYQATYRSGETQGVPVYFIDIPELYDRPGLYGEAGRDYPDNAERFGVLSRGALELTRLLNFVPDVIHAHDWQTGLVPVYQHQLLWRDPFFAGTGSLFSIHNLGYQGLFPLQSGRALGLDDRLLTDAGLEYHGQISLLKGGIRFANQVNTVSPSYCREIQSAERGMGLDGLLRSRSDRLHGLLNGLDETLWSPAHDRALQQVYSPADLSGKALCKMELQKELGLPGSARTPLLVMITRLDRQKGIELVLEGWDRIMARDLQLVILGTGDPDLEHRLLEAAHYYPDQARVILKFADPLARRIYAGSDLFLMPSFYEPCGLGQLIALRYGSVPVVHATGGLADTITDPHRSAASANGFSFAEYSHNSLFECLDRALQAYGEESRWRQLVLRGMTQDISWARAARQYIDLYYLCSESDPAAASECKAEEMR